MAEPATDTSTAAAAPIARTIGEFAAGLVWADVPAQVRERAKLSILDALGIAVAANRYGFAETIRSGLAGLAALDGSSGTCRVIGCGDKLPLRDAVLINGALIHGLDYDDTHMASVVHATAAALPTALTVAEAVDADGEELLAAYLAAAELAIRIGLAANYGFHETGLHATGIAAHFAGAVAAGRLFGLDAAALAAAQGITGSTAMASQEFVADGAWNKRFHPGWGGVAGITAAKLAEAGFIAPSLPYEGRFGLYHSLVSSEDADLKLELMTDGLGRHWEAEHSAIKPFPTCHFTHAAADCALYLAAEHDIDPAKIASIEVALPDGTIPVIAEPRAAKLRPVSDYDAKFSVQFIVAAALHRRRFGLAELDPDCLADPAILATARKVRHRVDPDSTFPAAYSGGVAITLENGETVRRYEAVNRGAGARALSAAEIEAKFMENAGLMMGEAEARAIRDKVMALESGSARDLMSALTP